MIKKNVVVFDLDETLGSFSQLYKFWNLINIFFNTKLDDSYFFNILDNNILFLRPNILNAINLLKYKKENKLCSNVIIYTNNNGPIFWADLIKDYLNTKANYTVIDKIIRAFKIDGKIIEPCRTSHGKSFSDFIKCTKLNENTNICFFDDQMHKNMIHDNVLYINLEAYNYNVEYSILVKKFYIMNLNLFKKKNKNYNNFYNFIIEKTKNDNLEYINKSNVKKNIEFLMSKQIMKILKKFLYSKNFTRKNKKSHNNTR